MRISLWNGKAKWVTLASLSVLVIVAAVSMAQKPRSPLHLALSAAGPYLGIEIDDVTAENMSAYKLTSERGVIVRSVEKESPAEYAELKTNDVILEYAGTPVFSAAQLTRLVRETPPGRKRSCYLPRRQEVDRYCEDRRRR